MHPFYTGFFQVKRDVHEFQSISLLFMFIHQGSTARAELVREKKRRPHVECLFQCESASLHFRFAYTLLVFELNCVYCDNCGRERRSFSPYQRMNYSSDLRPNPLFSCCTNTRPGDKDHAPSAQSIDRGETIKETALINENKPP